MIKLDLFLVSYDRLDGKVIQYLDDKETECIKCYAVQKKVHKNITPKVKVIKEWELEWNDYSFQQKQYYEYSAIVHLVKNIEVLKNITHIGILHYDVLFGKNSINNIMLKLTGL
jgi:hypothetical protein